MQWGDVDSANLLAEVLRPPDPPTLMLLAAYRSEDAESSAFVRRLLEIVSAADCAVEPIEVSVLPLSPAESRELAVALLGDEGRAAWEKAEEVARESRGNPFFVAELVRHIQGGEGIRAGVEDGEVDLDDVLWARIQRLPADARRLLEVVAVSGRPLREADAFRCLDGACDSRRAMALLRSGRFARGVAGPDGEEIETYHDRVRETVVSRLAPEVLVEHHRRLAASLEAIGQGRSGGAGPSLPRRGRGQQGRDLLRPSGGPRRRFARLRSGGEALRDGAGIPFVGDRAGRPTSAVDGRRPSKRRAEGPRLLAPTCPPSRARRLPTPWSCAARTALQYLISGHIDEGLAALRDVSAPSACSSPRRPSGPWCRSCGDASSSA